MNFSPLVGQIFTNILERPCGAGRYYLHRFGAPLKAFFLRSRKPNAFISNKKESSINSPAPHRRSAPRALRPTSAPPHRRSAPAYPLVLSPTITFYSFPPHPYPPPLPCSLKQERI